MTDLKEFHIAFIAVGGSIALNIHSSVFICRYVSGVFDEVLRAYVLRDVMQHYVIFGGFSPGIHV